MTRALSVAWVAFFLSTAGPASAQGIVSAADDRNQAIVPTTISARGEATVKKMPDVAWITVSTNVTASKPEDARRQSADQTTSILSQLKSTGLAADAIRTLGFDLSPMYTQQDGGKRNVSYSARNTIEVRVDDLDKLSAVIDTVMAPKNSGLSIDGPRFDVKDRAKAEEDALSQAVASALSRARAMARGDGLQVLATTKIEEEGVSSPSPGPRPMYRAMAAAASAPTPIEAGPIEITASVVVTVVAGK